MAFFKTKQEKEIIAKMEREEQMEAFNEQINELKSKRQEYESFYLHFKSRTTICIICISSAISTVKSVLSSL